MIELLQTVYFGSIGDEAAVLWVDVLEDDAAHSAVNECHGAHETGFDVRDENEVLEVVLFTVFPGATLYVLLSQFGSKQHYRVINHALRLLTTNISDYFE